MFHGSEICWALTLVTDTSSTSSLININLLHRTCHAYIIYVRYTKGSKVHITTDPARGMVYNTDKKTDNDTMLFVIILVIKKIKIKKKYNK